MKELSIKINREIHSFTDNISREFSLLENYWMSKIEFKDRALLIYIDKVLDHYIAEKRTNVNFIHLNFPKLDHQHIIAILKYVAAKFLVKGVEEDIKNQNPDDLLDNKIAVTIKKKGVLQPPSNARAGSLALKTYHKQLDHLDQIAQFYSILNSISGKKATLRPETVINLGIQNLEALLEEGIPQFGVDVRQYLKSPSTQHSYIILNAAYGFKELCDKLSEDCNDIIFNLKNIIVFDSNKSFLRSFNTSNLGKLNEQGCSVKNLILINFEDDLFSLNRALLRHANVCSIYHYKPTRLNEYCYWFTENETYSVLKTTRPTKPELNIEWVGELDWFQDLLNLLPENNDLKELSSIKMRNVFACCVNEKMKATIVGDLNSLIPELISMETKQAITELGLSTNARLQTVLNNLLDEIIRGWQQISLRLNSLFDRVRIALILPNRIISNERYLNLFRTELARLRFNIYTWYDLKKGNINEENIAILAYQDTGPFPFRIRPSIFEGLSNEKYIVAFFHKPLFYRTFENAAYQYNNELYRNFLNNGFRREYLDWKQVIKTVESHRPSHIDTFLIDLNDDQENDYDRETITVRYSDKSSCTCYPSKRFLVLENGNYHVFTAEELSSRENLSQISLQELDQTYADLDLIKITKEEYANIDLLLQRYNLTEEENESELWKVLLRRKCVDQNTNNNVLTNKVYDALSELSNSKSIEMVSKSYFKRHWIELKSELLKPLRNKLFKIVCEYLDLPYLYFSYLIKKSAQEKRESKRSTLKTNALLTDLVSLGLFSTQDYSRLAKAIPEIKKKYELEDFGIDSENALDGLTVLIELVKENLSLKTITTISHNE